MDNDQLKRHGHYPEIDEIVQYIKENPRGVDYTEIKEEFSYSPNKMEKLMSHALGTGKVIVDGRGGGKTRRFFHTKNQEFIVDDYHNDKVVEEVRDKLNEIKENMTEEELKNSEFRLTIQGVVE